MNENLTSLGIGGIIAFLVIKELFSYLKAKKQNGSGEKPPEYWQLEIEKIVNASEARVEVNQRHIIDKLNNIIDRLPNHGAGK